MLDRHIRRSGDDYGEALADLLPYGQAWPRWHDSTLMRTVRGLAQVFGFVDGRAADLLETESDPRLAYELLPDWERNWGLPDPCFVEADATSLSQRRAVLLLKMTLLGAQSRAFFIKIASWLGYTITITEYSPFMAGVSQCGNTSGMKLWNDAPGTYPEITDFFWQIGPPEMRFYWTVHVTTAALTWFRAGAGEAGVDPHLKIGLAVDLECLLRRFKPAHTDIVFSYENLQSAGSMTGLP